MRISGGKFKGFKVELPSLKEEAFSVSNSAAKKRSNLNLKNPSPATIDNLIRSTQKKESKKDSTLTTRPTMEAIREAFFNSLAARDLIQDSFFIDLFAGSGVVGIEAISRGAAHALFVEKNGDLVKALKANITKFKINNISEVFNLDFKKFFLQSDQLKVRLGNYPRTIIFIDPPYDLYDYSSIIKIISDAGIINKQTIFVIEQRSPKGQKNKVEVGVKPAESLSVSNQNEILKELIDRYDMKVIFEKVYSEAKISIYSIS